jgi:hypothetical protein
MKSLRPARRLRRLLQFGRRLANQAHKAGSISGQADEEGALEILAQTVGYSEGNVGGCFDQFGAGPWKGNANGLVLLAEILASTPAEAALAAGEVGVDRDHVTHAQ